MSSTEELIGRKDVDDVDAILAVTNTEADEVAHAVRANAEAIFTWDYEQSRKPLQRLYDKAKTSQWNARDLPWDTDVDQEAVAVANQVQNGWADQRVDLTGSPFEHWGDKEWLAYNIEAQNWTLSQFLHGEQGALICTAQIVETVPWIDAKYYASTQVMDEARHVEVFSRVPLREAVRLLPDQRAPQDAPRRHRLRQPLGHDVPRHADHGRGPRPRRVRVHAADDDRAAPQEAAPLRHERRGPPRRVRGPVAQGVLRRALRGRDPRAPGVRLRSRGPHARPVPPTGGLGAHGRATSRRP